MMTQHSTRFQADTAEITMVVLFPGTNLVRAAAAAAAAAAPCVRIAYRYYLFLIFLSSGGWAPTLARIKYTYLTSAAAVRAYAL